ncbi:MAG: MOSC domain-containing protein [Erysipelotrichaceae bacterium]|nr:MOSC domain-containing protein [Erysipelotrichaceae bacterium]
MGKVIAVCTSEKRGVQKKEVDHIVLRAHWGIESDAHAGDWHRQVSLLDLGKITDFKNRGVDVDFGAFGENIITEGFDWRQIPVDTQIRIGDCVLALTQIGKECHDHCAIYHAVGDCIMPREGVFTEVIKGGTIRKGDAISLLPLDPARPFSAAVITLSDRAFEKKYTDESGPLIKKELGKAGYRVVEQILIPDHAGLLKQHLIRLADQRFVNVIFTTGGTGFSARDITPETTEQVCEKKAYGIAEALRMESLKITPKAMLSRQTAGIRKQTLIINLPGSPKACKENLDIVLPVLDHGLGILRGTDTD